MVNEIPTAENMSKRIESNQLVQSLKPITAMEVIEEFQRRCSNGMQYTTFSNTISETEKSKLTNKGYVITENTIPSDVRYGAGDLYIGFQVALSARAAEEHMQITPNESNLKE